MGILYTAAVIGLGRIGALYPSKNTPRSHTAAYIKNSKVRMVAGVDPDPDVRSKFRELWGGDIELFSSVGKMLDEWPNIDIVSICTTPDVLQKNVDDFSDYLPKIFFLEKPTISSAEQGNKLLQLTGITPVVVNYHRCWDPKHIFFFNKLNNKKIFSVRVLYSKGLINYASHIIALLIKNFGDVVSITQISEEKENRNIVDQSYKFTLHFKQGFSAIFQGFDNINYDLLEMDFITNSGIYSLKSGGCRQRYEEPTEDVFYPNYSSLTDLQLEVEDGQVEGLSQAVENIVDYLDKKTDKLECDLQLGLDVFKVIEQVRSLYQS